MVVLCDGKIELPALTTAHSHAFQRGMRGKAQRRGPADADDFWSWREAMYSLAESLTPESMYDLATVAYRELFARGVRTVGEFHYVHHQADGTPYDDRTVLSNAVIRAARDTGLRIALLRVVYHRAGAGRAPEGAQRRFSDPSLDSVFLDIDDLARQHADDDKVRIGIAPHSVRAVPPDWLPHIARFAEERAMMVHMHLAEQPAEIEACLDETRRRPIELVAQRGLLTERFVAVHATHLAEHEPSLLGASNCFACICPTTERDLGDGLPPIGPLLAAGVRLCMGVDSHVLSNPIEDMRSVELGERLRTLRRVTIQPDRGTLAEALWKMGSSEGAAACGFGDDGATISLRRDAPELQLVADEELLDAIVFSGTTSLFEPERAAGVLLSL